MSDDIAIIAKSAQKKTPSNYLTCCFLCLSILLCLCAVFTVFKKDVKVTIEEEVNRDTFKAAVVEYAVVVPLICRKVRNITILHQTFYLCRGCVHMRRLLMR